MFDAVNSQRLSKDSTPCYSKDMAKVTSKLQVTMPKALAARYGIAPGDDIAWEAAGDVIRVVPPANGPHALSAAGCDSSTRQRPGSRSATRPRASRRTRTEAGRETTSTIVAALVDTNVLVYRFDARFPEKQRRATDLLRRGIREDSVRVPHQAVIEFVAAVTRPVVDGRVLLPPEDARREAEELLSQFDVLYPNEALVRAAIRGAAAYQLSWFDAHLWAVHRALRAG